MPNPRLQFLLAVIIATLLAICAPASAGEARWPQLRALLAAADPVRGNMSAELPTKGPVIVTFFASWCPPCRDEFVELNQLAAKGADTTIIGVNLFEDFGGAKVPARMERFLDHTRPQFPLVVGSQEIRLAFGAIDRIPSIVVFGRSGAEVWRFRHQRNATKTHASGAEISAAVALAQGG